MPNASGVEPGTAELDSIYEACKNWGRWGADDQRGALNHQTPEHRVAAAALVREGRTLSLAHDLPTAPSAETPFPAQHHMLAAGDARDSSGVVGYEACGDFIGTQVHGLGLTHIDALCHMFVRGEMYNAVPASEVKSNGALRNTIMSVADGLLGRGVLLDIPAALGVDFVPADQSITVDDLQAAAERQHVSVGPGDLLLVSTGRDNRRTAHHNSLSPFTQGLAGLHPNCLPWLHERCISVLGGDGISDHMPFRSIPDWPFPIHQIGITGIGLHLIDNMHLGALAELCQELDRWEFLLTVNSIRIPRGTGCPVNPIAVF
jgi:kynurenine formamidase